MINHMPNLKIMTDAMFGKLGKFLRLLGFDTALADNSWPDPKVMEHAIEENRALITRDDLFYQIAQEHYKENDIDEKYLLHVPHQDLEHQLAVFFKKYNIDPKTFKFNPVDSQSFDSRCSKCNSEVKIVKKDEIKDKISKGTSENYENFWQCTNPKCEQIYWIGHAHWDDINKKIKVAASYMDDV